MTTEIVQCNMDFSWDQVRINLKLIFKITQCALCFTLSLFCLSLLLLKTLSPLSCVNGV